MKILDCTIRDGGYYTNWDFTEATAKEYVESLNDLPIDYIEIGYRSTPASGYYGMYYYCPQYVVEEIKKNSNKKLAIMINEKAVDSNDAKELLTPLIGFVDMIRLAVNPTNLDRAIKLAIFIKNMGFEIGFNVMYMSKWLEDKEFIGRISNVDGVVDYFYMVDSYGGVYPRDIEEIFKMVKSKTDVKIGFHGHNNLELALINTLTAIDCGVDMVDATITGMGRGAGNLKTELLLTALNQKGHLEFDYNVLSRVVDHFSNIQKYYEWGTNLPYMVSGANSLPQKEVMEWVGKRFYSYNSIIRALTNQSKGIKDNLELDYFDPTHKSSKVMIIGGGPSGTEHAQAVNEYLNENLEVNVIHASSRNAKSYNRILNKQIHCLSGNEGYRLESTFKNMEIDNRIAILPPYPRFMGTYIPKLFNDSAFQLKKISFTDEYLDSVTAVSIQTALDLGAKEIIFVGYDGYKDEVNTNELELFNENERLFSKLKETNTKVISMTKTNYQELALSSIYAYI